MYEAHPKAIVSDNHNTIWKYMDFTKLLCMLRKKTLFFCRLDQIKKYDDFEYSDTQASRNSFNNRLTEMLGPNGTVTLGTTKCDYESAARITDEIRKLGSGKIAVNCWHSNEYESLAMWKVFLKSEEGVVVKTSVARLKKAFISPQKIYIGQINYYDYSSEDPSNIIKSDNIISHAFYKRKYFIYENEIRALIVKSGPESHDCHGNWLDLTDTELHVSVDLDMLIDRILVHPHSPNWFFELVKEVSHPFLVEKSTIANRPL